MEKRGLRGDLPLPFTDVIVGDGGAVDDTPHPADGAATGQHGLAEHRLAGRRVPDDGEVADIRGTMRHIFEDETEMASVQASRHESVRS